ncbi:DUF2795 domain-containing protein [Actinomycetospora sp. CA-084318]|uniref:DUF2795 domain-containing protein n=1 Tax=Actinomycetospora sp. CA-084318 TaxID=3239892 RepID=UPI003D96C351
MRASAFAAVLGDVAFPLGRDEIAAAAEDHGVDPLMRRKIAQLPDREYTDVYDIVVALSSTPAHLGARRPL